MFENLKELLNKNADEAVINNPAIPNEKKKQQWKLPAAPLWIPLKMH